MSIAIDEDSAQRHDSDSALLSKNFCPVCLLKVGTTRHALSQHFYRKKKIDLEHALYMDDYREHFRHGRSKKPTRRVQTQELASMLRRHVGKQRFAELLKVNIQV